MSSSTSSPNMRFPGAVRSLSTRSSTPLLLTPSQFQALPRKNTLALDVSWHMPNSPRNAAEEFRQGPRIRGAQRFDLDLVADKDEKRNPLGLGHMLPTIETFREAAGKLGITRDTHVVVYDSVGVFASPRGLFTFKAMGHDKVSVLDGGMPAWIEDGGQVDVGEVRTPKAVEYTGGAVDTALVRSYAQMVANASKGDSTADIDVVLDARAAPRFLGEAPEPRPNLSSGHMPHSVNLPFTEFIVPAEEGRQYTTYKKPEELREVLVNAVGGEEAWKKLVEGGEAHRALVFTCGSGMTACVGWLATQIVAEREPTPPAAIYDESWTGYASRPESKILKG